MAPGMDWLDDFAASWASQLPGRDLSSVPPLARLGHLASLMDEFQKRVLAPHGLTPSEYSILGALRRAGLSISLNQTIEVSQALALVDVKVIDHFIVAGRETLSMLERGMI